MQEEEEIWKDIPGYEGIYKVSSFGEVKSLNYNRTNTEKLLTKSLDSSKRYFRVGLSNNTVLKTVMVHQIVAMAFLGYKRNGKLDVVVDHIDNDKFNNKLSNLQLVSNRINAVKDRKRSVNLPSNIYKHGSGYAVRFGINYKTVSFGTYRTVEEALSKVGEIKNNLKLW